MNEIEKSRIQEITRLHTEVLGYVRISVEGGISIGGLLQEQKAGMKHGEWIPWIKKNCPFSERLARDYMRFYDRREELKTASLADLSQARKLLTEHGTPNEKADIERELKRIERCEAEIAKKVDKLERLAKEIESNLKGSWNSAVSAELVVLHLLIMNIRYSVVYRGAKVLMDIGYMNGDAGLVNEGMAALNNVMLFKKDLGGAEFKKSEAYKRLRLKYEFVNDAGGE